MSKAAMLEPHLDRAAPSRNRYRWVIRLGMTVALLLVLVLATDRLLHPEQFPITEIRVAGELHKVDNGAVKSVVEANLKGNFFSLNLTELEQAVARMPWVFSASVRRVWPATVVVEVIELKPVAAWGEDKWLHITGELVARRADGGIEANSTLPQINGPETRHRKIWQLFRQWSARFLSLGLSLDRFSLDDTGLWTLRFSAIDAPAVAVTLVVEDTDAGRKIDRFVLALEHGLSDRLAEMNDVDLRYPNGFAVQWRQEMLSATLPSAQTQNAREN